jgi:hypothetical protein
MVGWGARSRWGWGTPSTPRPSFRLEVAAFTDKFQFHEIFLGRVGV